jgi:hypothetical protein
LGGSGLQGITNRSGDWRLGWRFQYRVTQRVAQILIRHGGDEGLAELAQQDELDAARLRLLVHLH